MIRSIGLTESERLVRETTLECLADCADKTDAARHAFQVLAGLGILAVPLAEAEGGMGEGLGNAALVLEPLGHHALVTPFIETVCVPAAIAECYPGFLPLQAALQSAAGGGAGAVLAWMEEARGWSRSPRSTVARRQGEDWLLSGVKPLVRWGGAAAAFIVTAMADGAAGLFWVPADCRGVTLRNHRAADGRTLTDVVLDDVVLPPDSRIDTGGGEDAIDYALDAAASLSMAEAVGLMNRLLEMTVDYLKAREQFGGPLSRMQALQHRLVDIYADVECAWSLSHDAACCLSRDVLVDERRKTVSSAKAYVGRLGRRAGQEALQMHGAIGMTKEYPLGRYLQRLTALSLDYGDSDWHLGRLADALREDAR